MHVSLLQESRRGDGCIAHCLRPIVARLPTTSPNYDVSAAGRDIPDHHAACTHKNRMVSATPLETSAVLGHSSSMNDLVLSPPSSKCGSLNDLGTLDEHVDGNAHGSFGFGGQRMADKDCFELTVVFKQDCKTLPKVLNVLAELGVNVSELHCFCTTDRFYLYWIVLEGWDAEGLDGLDGLLRQRLGAINRASASSANRALFTPPKERANERPPRSRRTSLDRVSAPPTVHRDGAGRNAATPPHPMPRAHQLSPSRAGGSIESVRIERLSGGHASPTLGASSPGREDANAARGGLSQMKKGSSFLNLWQLDLQVGHLDMGSWEIDPDRVTTGEMIGRGAFGKIYKGEYKGQTVAVKYIASDFSKEFDNVQEFMQEINVISKIQHENIVKFIGACTKQENVCILYEFMDGGNLRDALMKRGNHKPNHVQLLKYAKGIIKAMSYLTSQGILHRDLKAQNILMNTNGEIKVGDFGVARWLPRDSKQEMMTGETGTYRWMAPEVIERRPYGYPADVYSFGVVLWEMFTYGKVPYELLSPVQAAVGVAKHGIRPKIPSSVPEAVRKIMEICWDADPLQRPTFETLEGMVDAALVKAEETKSAKPKTFTSLLSKMMKS